MEELPDFQTYTIINFGQILAACRKHGAEIDQSFFMQMQSGIFTGWVDRLRTASDCSTRVMLSTLPASFSKPDVLRRLAVGWLSS